jgi:hypothetical protein
MTTATTLRLPAPLHAEASAYADSLGVPLNALMAIALRDYLDQRPKAPSQAAPMAPVMSRQERRARERQTLKSVSRTSG